MKKRIKGYKPPDENEIKKKKKIQKLFYEDFKNNESYKQEVHIKTKVKKVKVVKIPSNIYYEGVTFYKVTFYKVNLEKICFHKCKFYYCNFINVTSNYELSSLQGFSFCNFTSCKFDNCKLQKLFFCVGIFRDVQFKDTFFREVFFQLNAFNCVTFEGNCNMHATNFLSPTMMFDIQFLDKDGVITIDERCNVSSFLYNSKINIDDISMYNIWRKMHYQKIASTYYGFEKLFERNSLLDWRSNCYYERKKAETRSKTGIQSILGYIAEWTFGYGEYPFRSLICLILITILYAPLYMLSGFNNGITDINYDIDLLQSFTIDFEMIYDFLESIYYSFFTLITVGQGTSQPISSLTKVLVSSELFLGVIVMTTFTATLFRKITK